MKRAKQQAELDAEYSPKVAAQKPAREAPAEVWARTNAVLRASAVEEQQARAKARAAITDRRELERQAKLLERKLRGEE